MSSVQTGAQGTALSAWARDEIEAGGWVRRAFLEGQRLRAIHGADAVADLALGQPLEADESVREAFLRAAAERFPGRFGYMPNLGYGDVRERVAADVAFPGMSADAIVMTVGAAGALSLALRAFVEAGSEVVAVAPYFSEFRLYTAATGSRLVVATGSGDGTIDLEAIGAVLTPRTGAIIVNTPNNPGGRVASEVEFRRLAGLLHEHERRYNRRILLIVDEVYHRLVYAPTERVEPFAHYEHTVLARSFSKDLGIAGERIGYLAVHPTLVTLENQRGLELCHRAGGVVNAPATAQRALLQLPNWSIDLGRYRELRDFAYGRARSAGLDLVEPQGGIYLWIRSPWEDTLAFVAALADRLVLVSPGIAFSRPDHYRICFSVPRPSLEMAMTASAEILATGDQPPGGGKGGIRTPGGAQHPSPA